MDEARSRHRGGRTGRGSTNGGWPSSAWTVVEAAGSASWDRRLLQRGLASIAARHGLTLGDWEALSALQRSSHPYEIAPKQLAAALGVTSGTMSVRIERLAQAGLVEPGAARSDGRSRPVRLTAQGRERWRAATAERTAAEWQLVTEALSGEELTELNPLLSKLLARLEQASGRAPVHGALRADER